MTYRVRVDRAVDTGDEVAVDEATAHHLRDVLRLRVGDAVLVATLSAELFEASVNALAPLVLKVERRVERGGLANPRVGLTIFLPLLKGGKADGLVRQLTELGVSEIVPWLGVRSVVRLDDAKAAKRQARWQRIADESTRQCRRTDRVNVHPVLRRVPSDRSAGIFFYEDGAQPLREALSVVGGLQGGSLSVLIGPEGGLASEEVAALRDAGWAEAWLGPRVLRAETAVVAATVVVLQQLGEFAASDRNGVAGVSQGR